MDDLNAEIEDLAEEPIGELNDEISGIKEEVETITEEVREQAKDQLEALNKRIEEINKRAGPLYASARELAEDEISEINSEVEKIERSYAERIAEVSRRFNEAQEVIETELENAGQKVIDDFKWPKPEAATADDDPLFDSKRDYVEQIGYYKKHSGKLTERKRYKHWRSGKMNTYRSNSCPDA